MHVPIRGFMCGTRRTHRLHISVCMRNSTNGQNDNQAVFVLTCTLLMGNHLKQLTRVAIHQYKVSHLLVSACLIKQLSVSYMAEMAEFELKDSESVFMCAGDQEGCRAQGRQARDCASESRKRGLCG